MGIFGSTAATGPAIAPTIGSALTTGWGWRSIFMFLFVLAALELIILLFFLPEYVCPYATGFVARMPALTNRASCVADPIAMLVQDPPVTCG